MADLVGWKDGILSIKRSGSFAKPYFWQIELKPVSEH